MAVFEIFCCKFQQTTVLFNTQRKRAYRLSFNQYALSKFLIQRTLPPLFSFLYVIQLSSISFRMLSTLFSVLKYCSALISFPSVFRYFFCVPHSFVWFNPPVISCCLFSNMFALLIQLFLNGRYCCLFDEFIIAYVFLYVNIYFKFSRNYF